MKKIKQFVKDHKRVIIGTIIGGIGGTVACTIAYKTGFRSGALQTTNMFAAMVIADKDSTAMIVESCIQGLDDDGMKKYIAYGNELIKNATKKELA